MKVETQFCQMYPSRKSKHKFTCYVRNKHFADNETLQWKSGCLKKKARKEKMIVLWLFHPIQY